MPLDMRGGHQTFWRNFGDGSRHALAIHCSLAHSGAWRDVAAVLSDDWTLTAFDLPGHGRSAPWDGQVEIQGLSVEMGLDLLNQNAGPIDVMGHSFGATVALRLAFRAPERVRRLVLIEPVFFAAALQAEPGIRARFEAEWVEFGAAIDRGDRHMAARLFTEVYGAGTPWADLKPAAQDAMAAQIHLITAAHPALSNDVGDMLAPGKLELLDRDVLLIEGAQTNWIVPRIQAALAARLPRAQRHIVPNAGHMAPITHPVLVGQSIRTFLAS